MLLQPMKTALHTAQHRRVPIAPLSAEEPALTTAEAYAIQRAWFGRQHDLWMHVQTQQDGSRAVAQIVKAHGPAKWVHSIS